jgi:hypothetical protein
MLAVDGAQARKTRVDHPQIGATPGDFMNMNVAGEMTIARQKDRVVFAGRLEIPGDIRLIAKIPDVVPGPDGEPTVITGHPHRRLERAKMRVDHVVLNTGDNHLAGLVGRDQQAGAEPIQDLRQGIGVNAFQRGDAIGWGF